MLFDKFMALGLDAARIGLEPSDGPAYFCTPEGAEIFARAGVDGIHYCFVEGFGEMVFAVSPMNGPGEQVHPLARSFADFLRLLLVCGDACILEQLWSWDRARYDAVCRENPPTPEQREVLDAIAQGLNLTPMADPFDYVKELQGEFDPGRLSYSQEYWDSLPAAPEPPEWKVYFEGGFWGGSGRERAGTEFPIGKWFDWAGERWYIPAVYACGKGLVVDFCIRVELERIQAFLDKWGLTAENEWGDFTPDQERQIEEEHPLNIDFKVRARLNGRELRPAHSYAVTWNPCISPEPQEEARQVVEHYGLDPGYGWSLHRVSFPWQTKRRPTIRSLSVTLKQAPAAVPGPHFHVSGPGDRVELTHPGTGAVYTLTVEEYRREELSGAMAQLPAYEFPRHCIAMEYTLSPEPENMGYTVSDCAEADPPRLNGPAPEGAAASGAIGIIGGSDGPVAFVVTSGPRRPGVHSACSSPRFQPAEDVEWHVVFYEKKREDIILDCI